MTISNPESFREEARFQRVCANCGSAGAFHAHHVLPKQALGKLGLVHRLYDPRNALRLCEGLDTNRCHMELEKRNIVVGTDILLDENICFLWEVLKQAGQNFLERYHTGVDRRFTRHTEGGCPICQLPHRQ